MKAQPNNTVTAHVEWVESNAPAAAVQIDTAPGYYNGALKLSMNGHEMTDQADYDDRFDVYYHQSDDGTRYYSVVRVLSPTDNPQLPDPMQLEASAKDAMMKLLDMHRAGRGYEDSIQFGNAVLFSPVFMHKAWCECGCDIKAAHLKVLNKVFDYDGSQRNAMLDAIETNFNSLFEDQQ